jgi:hypothetical protein
MKQSRLPLSFCGACGERLDACTDPLGEADPKPGDLCVCGYCGRGHLFTDDLRQRLVTKEDFESLPKETQEQLVKFSIGVGLYPVQPFSARAGFKGRP